MNAIRALSKLDFPRFLRAAAFDWSVILCAILVDRND
jgi:hypothetical protein